MKASSYRSERDRADIVTLEIDVRDYRHSLNSREIMIEVRHLIAKEITDRLMKKLGPAIDAALSLPPEIAT